MSELRTFTVQPVVEVSAKDLAYWVTTAFEGGSNYWIDYANPVERTASGWHNIGNDTAKARIGLKPDEGPLYAEGKFWSDKELGYVIQVEDEDLPKVLTANRVLAGFGRLVKDGRHKVVASLLDGQYDAEDADLLIQYAMFDEVVYG